ncbi:hypothetical protein BCR39DRAFT_555736 [Naematelia encephala]|uniref:Uncharacterized protein n=1 Tax=Naematelia encephala TaxID=71784 RepID=A0A1Y2BN65_9TREE|nr:hypothetical protein BCR39DRAFT_555736 [Naematelia encephala]
MQSVMLIREPLTDLTPFPAPQIELARSQWLYELSRRMEALEAAHMHSAEEFEYGGPAAHALDTAPLDDAIDEARRMVCVLGGEMRRRSEGNLAPWQQKDNAMPRTTSAGV